MFLSDQLHAELLKHKEELDQKSLHNLFHDDAHRSSSYLYQASGLFVDFSKSLIDHEILRSLQKIPLECSLEDRISEMFEGKRINLSENRAVLHTALRASSDSSIMYDGQNIVPNVHDVLARMEEISNAIVSKQWRGSSGKAIATVVNIGIGGSDLGPAMATHALSPFRVSDIEQFFVSNVDPAEISSVLQCCDPETTLFVVASKTFTTSETLQNAEIAKEWLLNGLPKNPNLSQHFIAISTNIEAATQFGVDATNVLGFWEWVGGRFSLPSAIGLSLMIRIGAQQFSEFLHGLRDMDHYFLKTPLESNAIVLYSLIGIWYRHYLNFSSYAVLPYDSLLSRLPSYLQQLIMESNGKRVNKEGKPVDYNTSFVVWGESGTNGQHSFHQLLHQGTQTIPVDFLFAANSTTAYESSHDALIANALAQAKVLAFGSESEVPPHKYMPGNRPSISFLYESMSPYILGQIIAFYEHVVFSQGVIWNINSFDQWGVELGKGVATSLLPFVQSRNVTTESSESALIKKIHELRLDS